MGGFTGIDYVLLPEIMSGMGITKPKKRLELIDQLQIMEIAALNEMNKDAKKK